VTITGFSMPEIDVLIGELGAATVVTSKTDPADEIADVDKGGPSVTRLGDVWQIGQHRLVCGDSTAPATYAHLLGGERAQMVFTDPPYNVKVNGHVCGLGAVKHRDFTCARKATSNGDILRAVPPFVTDEQGQREEQDQNAGHRIAIHRSAYAGLLRSRPAPGAACVSIADPPLSRRRPLTRCLADSSRQGVLRAGDDRALMFPRCLPVSAP
jgi:hypothetical protein